MVSPPPEIKILLVLAKIFFKIEIQLFRCAISKTRACLKYFVSDCGFCFFMCLVGYPNWINFDWLLEIIFFTSTAKESFVRTALRKHDKNFDNLKQLNPFCVSDSIYFNTFQYSVALCWRIFLIKLQALRPAALFKRGSDRGLQNTGKHWNKWEQWNEMG